MKHRHLQGARIRDCLVHTQMMRKIMSQNRSPKLPSLAKYIENLLINSQQNLFCPRVFTPKMIPQDLEEFTNFLSWQDSEERMVVDQSLEKKPLKSRKLISLMVLLWRKFSKLMGVRAKSLLTQWQPLLESLSTQEVETRISFQTKRHWHPRVEMKSWMKTYLMSKTSWKMQLPLKLLMANSQAKKL